MICLDFQGITTRNAFDFEANAGVEPRAAGGQLSNCIQLRHPRYQLPSGLVGLCQARTFLPPLSPHSATAHRTTGDDALMQHPTGAEPLLVSLTPA